MRATGRGRAGIILGLLAALSCCPGGAVGFERAVLDNGLVTVVGQNTAANVAAVFVGFRVSAATETQGYYPARALLQEHDRSRLAELLESDPGFSPLAVDLQAGGRLRFNTEWDYVQLAATCTPQNLDLLLQLVARVIFADSLSPELAEAARQRLTQHSTISQAQPPEQAYYLFRQAMLGETPAARPVFGDPESIEALTLDELTAFRQRYFVAGNAAIVIVSPQSAQEIGQLVQRSFGSYRQGRPSLPTTADPRSLRQSDVQVGSDSLSGLATVVLGVALHPPGTKGFRVGQVLHQILAGPQGRLRRDRALLRSLALNLPFQLLVKRFPLRALPVTLEANPYLAIYAEADPTALESTRRALLRHFDSFQEGSIRPDELVRAKQRVINDMALTMQRPTALATRLGQYEMLGLDCTGVQHDAAQVAALTIQDIVDTVNDYSQHYYIGVLLPDQRLGSTGRQL